MTTQEVCLQIESFNNMIHKPKSSSFSSIRRNVLQDDLYRVARLIPRSRIFIFLHSFSDAGMSREIKIFSEGNM